MAFNGNEGDFISLTTAATFTSDYRNSAMYNGVQGLYLGKNKLEDLLAQTGAVGLRMYFGLDEYSNLVLVVVAVDSNKDDILTTSPLILDRSIPCPTECGQSNDLNS